MDVFEESEHSANTAQKLAAALAYAGASTLIMFVNKIALTAYGFPSFLAIALVQCVMSIVVLLIQRRRGSIKPFPLFDLNCIRDVFPVPLIFMANTISGLGATKKLSMPLFVLLRRFSIVMTMVLEAYILKKKFPTPVKGAVGFMIIGAIIASSVDMSFELSGVMLILINNLATALQGVGLRKKMDQLSHTAMGTSGIMYYNNLTSLPFVLALVVFRPGELASLAAFQYWDRIDFLIVLFASAVMGFVLNFTYYWCTKANSPTTTTVIGAFKNIITSFVGMLFSDYIYSNVGFIGINVSVFGSLWYNYEEYKKMMRNDAERALRQKDSAMEAGGSKGCAKINVASPASLAGASAPSGSPHFASPGGGKQQYSHTNASPTNNNALMNSMGGSMTHRASTSAVPTPMTSPSGLPPPPSLAVASTLTVHGSYNDPQNRQSAREVMAKRFTHPTNGGGGGAVVSPSASVGSALGASTGGHSSHNQQQQQQAAGSNNSDLNTLVVMMGGSNASNTGGMQQQGSGGNGGASANHGGRQDSGTFSSVGDGGSADSGIDGSNSGTALQTPIVHKKTNSQTSYYWPISFVGGGGKTK